MGEETRDIEHLFGFQEPIGGEDCLQFQDDRTCNARDKLLVSRIGVDDVLGAGVPNPAVNHEDLPVIAQIGSGGSTTYQSEWQHQVSGYASGSESLKNATRPLPRTKSIDKNSARDAPPRRLNKGFDHSSAGSVICKNVDDQVNVISGTFDIRNEFVDETVVVAEKFRIVAGQRGKLAEVLYQRSGLNQIAREKGRTTSLYTRELVGRSLKDRAQSGEANATPPWIVRPPNENI